MYTCMYMYMQLHLFPFLEMEIHKNTIYAYKANKHVIAIPSLLFSGYMTNISHVQNEFPCTCIMYINPVVVFQENLV